MNAIVIHDKAIIPNRAENLLAVRWQRLAIKEGHMALKPENETQKKQSAFYRSVFSEPHPNKARAAEAQQRVLDAMPDGVCTAKEIAATLGLHQGSVVKKLNKLHEAGRIEEVGERQPFKPRYWRRVT